jgi:hypothetical protein
MERIGLLEPFQSGRQAAAKPGQNSLQKRSFRIIPLLAGHPEF